MKTARTTNQRYPLARAAALAMAGSLALAACGQAENLEEDASGETSGEEQAAGSGSGEATIRFSWWGPDTRHQMNQDLIDAFEEEHPDITVVPEFGDISGYWDKLATQTAGNDMPDVMFQHEGHLALYADRGTLADLNEYDIDVSQFDDAILASGTFDGALRGIPAGVNARAFIADPQVFEEAGVEMPDDSTWTWEDYVEIAAEISANTPDGVYGTQEYGFAVDGDMAVWARQHGQELWEDGKVGFEPELMAERWQISLDLIESGGAPPATEALENATVPNEQKLIATGRAALGAGWSTDLQLLAEASGRDLQLLQTPGESQFERPGAYPRPGLFYSMSADTEYPEAAATFIDWLLNSSEAGTAVSTEYGVPPNPEIRDSLMDDLNAAQQQNVEYVAKVTEETVDGPGPHPAAGGEMWDILSRMNEQVLFGELNPQEAAEQYVQEAQSRTGD